MNTNGQSSTLGPQPSAPIGVFGGTFDPVHYGHLRIALDALETLGLQHVRLIPLAQAVHRDQPETPAAVRLAMLQAALAGRDDLVADARELQRAGPSYTIDTLRSLHQDFPTRSLCLLVGGDAFNGFAGWRNPTGILALANLAVLQRPGHALPRDPPLLELLAQHHVERLAAQPTGQIVFCPVTQLDIAASDIRARIAAGRRADFLTPPGVLELIARHGLYR